MLKTADLDERHRNRLFILSCIALVSSGFVFTMGTSVAKDLINTFNLSAEAVGFALGAWSLACAAFIFLGSPLCDYLGMGNLLKTASLCQIIGTLMIIFTGSLMHVFGSAATVLYISVFITGIGSGLIEAVVNPLISTLYPDNKTEKLNTLHAWWPGGIVMTGVIAATVQKLAIGGDHNWQIRFAIVLIPVLIYFFLALEEKFPATERLQAGVSTNEMLNEAFKPLYLVWFLCMFGTAAMELAPGRWVDAMLTRTVGFQGILLASYVAFIMFLFRFFAGAISHRFSPVGLMFISSGIAGIGLVALSMANSPVTGLLAATIWGVGVCFMWPTMLGVTSEQFPRGGAFLIGMTGTAGQLSTQIFVPIMGRIYDTTLKEALKVGKSQATAESLAGPAAFHRMAFIALILLVVFGAIWFKDKARGGYKAVKIIDD